MQQEVRERQFNLIVGMPGAGKSTFEAEKIVKPYQENVILVKHPANIDDKAFSLLAEKTMTSWRQGAQPGAPVKCKFAIESGKPYIELLNWAKANLRNGKLIIDDATIFERDRLSLEMNHLVAMRRHYGIDIDLVYHGLTLLPIEQFVFVNNIILFNTNDSLKYKASKMPNYQLLLKGVEQARSNFRAGGAHKYTPAIVPIS